jgi:hypothetical protein
MDKSPRHAPVGSWYPRNASHLPGHLPAEGWALLRLAELYVGHGGGLKAPPLLIELDRFMPLG